MSIRSFFEPRFNYKHEDGRQGEILDCAVVHRTTAYMAYRIKYADGTERVVALVILLGYAPRSIHNFGYKDMDETMGPCEDDCPKRIFDLLTPLPEGDEQYAHDWRARVRKKLDRPKPKSGDRIKFSSPITFKDGSVLDTFVIHKRGPRIWFTSESSSDGWTYKIRNWQKNEFEILPK